MAATTSRPAKTTSRQNLHSRQDPETAPRHSAPADSNSLDPQALAQSKAKPSLLQALLQRQSLLRLHRQGAKSPAAPSTPAMSSAITVPSSSSPSMPSRKDPQRPRCHSGTASTATPPASSSSNSPLVASNPASAPLAAAKREMIEETGLPRPQTLDPHDEVLRQPRLPRRVDADLPRRATLPRRRSPSPKADEHIETLPHASLSRFINLDR